MIDLVREYWNNEAPIHKAKAYGYGRNPKVRYPMYETRRERVLELLETMVPGRLLDAGCGTADVLQATLDVGWDAVGIDVAPNMVAGARASLQAKGHDPTRVREGTITDLSPWSDVSFDLVMCLGVLSYVPIADQPKFYSEAHRVLKPGGALIVQHVNALFDLFTLNRFTVDFYRQNLLSEFFEGEKLDEMTSLVAGMLAHPEVPMPTSALASVRDALPVSTEIPLIFAEKARSYGFREVDQIFMRLHTLPPHLFSAHPELEKVAIDHEKRLCRHWTARLMAAGFLSVLVKEERQIR